MHTSLGASAPLPDGQPIPPTFPIAQRIHLREERQVACLRIHPPLDAATLAELIHILERWQRPEKLKALLLDITACGCSASPITESALGKGTPESRQGRVRERALAVAMKRAQATIERMSAPILGVAAGNIPPPGSALLSSCDLLLAARDTIFLGEGGPFLPYRTRSSRPDQTGRMPERLSAYQAYRQGLVTWLAPAEQLSRETERILELLHSKSATTLALAKQALLIGLAHPRTPNTALKQIGELYLHDLMTTPDAVEGLRAFLEKRPPRWQETPREPAT